MILGDRFRDVSKTMDHFVNVDKMVPDPINFPADAGSISFHFFYKKWLRRLREKDTTPTPRHVARSRTR